MKRLGFLGLAILLTSPGVALAGNGDMQLAWQMGTTERGYTENFGDRSLADPDEDSQRGSTFGSDRYPGSESPGSGGSGDDDRLRQQPNLGGSYGGPYYRPWTARGCGPMGGGRNCF